jgi:hypothetical protein
MKAFNFTRVSMCLADNIIYIRLFTALLFLTIMGCKMERVEPPTEISITENKGAVNFEFSVPDTRWWAKPESRVPIKLQTITIYGDQGAVWEINAQDPKYAIDHVRYGVIPQGFKQLTPTNEEAPELQAGKEYQVVVRFGRARFVYGGGR